MAPAATDERPISDNISNLKKDAVNPFYSPSDVGVEDDTYEFAKYKVDACQHNGIWVQLANRHYSLTSPRLTGSL